MSANSSLPPRQKMINLMYIILTAMLALNVSSDVLDGFKQVEDGLSRSTENSAQQNKALFNRFTEQYNQNPEKTGRWYEQAKQITIQTDSLYQYIDKLKLNIVKNADGENGDPKNIRRQDDLEASAYIMLSPSQGNGRKLRQALDNYRTLVLEQIKDSGKRKAIEAYLSTEAPKGSMGKSWEEAHFESMPVAAAVTLLTQIQNDLRSTEAEVLHTLISNVDLTDVRVNQLSAFVIPQAKNVIRGGKYSAQIVLAAIDSTQQPTIYIDGKRLENSNGLYEFTTGKTGVFNFNGYLEVPRGDGSLARHDFSSGYTVVEPSATVSATMMNVLYANINNPVSISVPGIPNNAIQATMTNGTLTRGGADGWIAKPNKVGQNAIITVMANMDGRTQTVANMTFRVRQLPDPLPYIAYADQNGNERRFKGGSIAKSLLLNANELKAAIDDDLLNVSYRVTAFNTTFFDSMGNAMLELSNGAKFSDRQKEAIRRLSRGKRFFISGVKAIGPDGIERNISPIEVIVN